MTELGGMSATGMTELEYQGWRQLPKSGGGGETLPHLLAISLGIPLLFLEYIMQKGGKNEERNLNAWDRSFVKLDMPHT